MKKHLYFAVLLFLPALLMAQAIATKNNAVRPAAAAWSLRGNSNLNDTFNFLGTTDYHRLTFRVNNFQSGLIDLDSFQRNTTLGYQTLNSLSPYGFDNTAVGYQALQYNTDGHGNVALGVRTLYGNTLGSDNVAIGNGSLFSNSNGVYNVAIGGAMTSNTEGLYNIAIGNGSLTRNETGRDNIAIGASALFFSSASENTAVGYFGLYSNTTGTYNTAGGYLASISNTVGNNNTSYGSYAMYTNQSGNDNSAFGYQALYTNQTGRRITALGAGADVTDAGLRNSTAIGYGAKVDASNKVQIGNMNVKSIGGMVGWTNYSDARIKQDVKENVPGLSFLKQLKAVTYHLNAAKAAELTGGKKEVSGEGDDSQAEKILFTGFLAQDVDAAAKKIGYDFSGVDKTGKVMGLRYSEFVVPLVKAVQELSARNDSLQARLDKLEAMLSQSLSAGAFSSSSVPALPAATLSVYPNPAGNNLGIQFTAKGQSAVALLITDMKGSMVLQQSTNAFAGNNNITVNISALAKGSYTLLLQAGGTSLTKKFIKE